METLESPGSLHIYKGYALFKKDKIGIIKSSLGETKGLIVFHRGERFIIINGYFGMREQIKTIIHEFLHLSYNPRPCTPGISWSHQAEYEELEDKIEKETVRVYETQPRLVKHLRELLLETPYKENYRLEMERLYRKRRLFNQ